MRSLALAGIVAVLAGCSLPYVDTSFKATPKPEHIAEGVHHESNDRGPSESAPGAETATDSARGEVSASGGRKDQPLPDASIDDAGKKGQVGVAFPPTAQPAGG